MTASERKALDHHLSDYPKDKNFDEVIELIEAEDESILVWQVYERYAASELVEFINDMVDAEPALDLPAIQMFFDGFCLTTDDVIRYTGLQQADAERVNTAISILRKLTFNA